MRRDASQNLVVVRAGSKSLHPAWLAAGEDRPWDLIVSYYDHDAYLRRSADTDGVRHVFFAGGKWDGLLAALREPNLLDRYKYFWLPDDDIEATPEAIDQIFRLAREYDLAVCQPALTPDSYYSYPLLIGCDAFRIRFTTFVEIMVPCLRRDILKIVLPHFETSHSGFGLDCVWHRLQKDNWAQTAVLDCVRVRHTRPLTPTDERIAINGRHPHDERDDVLAAFDATEKYHRVGYAGITADGQLIKGTVQVGLRVAATHARQRRAFVTASNPVKVIWRVLREQLKAKADLSPLLSVTAGGGA
jgi:hypothetical protein